MPLTHRRTLSESQPRTVSWDAEVFLEAESGRESAKVAKAIVHYFLPADHVLIHDCSLCHVQGKIGSICDSTDVGVQDDCLLYDLEIYTSFVSHIFPPPGQ